MQSLSYGGKESEKEKNKYQILRQIYGRQKDSPDEPIC